MSETTCPLPTPELVAALANQFIEERLKKNANPMQCAIDVIVGAPDSERRETLVFAAAQLAAALGFPAPYECVVTLPSGATWPPERHTITYFTDDEGFEHHDWAAISALDVGESYTIVGHTMNMTVTRKE